MNPELPENGLKNMAKGLRHYYIAKIVKVVVPKPDANVAYDARVLEFLEYCKYAEKKAFERVRTRDEYFAALASIIFKLQKKIQQQSTPSDDPYGQIPPSHAMADFMGMSQEELKEFDELHRPQGSSAIESNSKERIFPHIRKHVVAKLGSMLFPAPNPFARDDGRMDLITEKLRQIEATAFEEAVDGDDYYNRASLAAYRLYKTMKSNGETYIDDFFWTPTINLTSEELPDLE